MGKQKLIKNNDLSKYKTASTEKVLNRADITEVTRSPVPDLIWFSSYKLFFSGFLKIVWAALKLVRSYIISNSDYFKNYLSLIERAEYSSRLKEVAGV